jgi:hypothetical protein
MHTYENEWFHDSEKVQIVLDYMARTYPVSRESMEQIAYAAEKPWKHTDLYHEAVGALA